MSVAKVASRVTAKDVAGRKASGHVATGDRLVVVTAYDRAFARLADMAGVDVILVGDSLGMVFQGQADTLPVTVEEMAYHGRAVARGRRGPMWWWTCRS